jgi:hypothetical protein
MVTIVRQSVGIDIAKASFTACICKNHSTGSIELSEAVQFDNCKTGFNRLLRWVVKKLIRSFNLKLS